MKKIILSILTLVLVPAILHGSTTPPNVLSRAIYSNHIEIFFDKDMDPDSINSDNFSLADYYRGTPISLTVYYSSTEHKAILIPDNDLRRRYPYRLTVKATVKDTLGNQMIGDYVRTIRAYTYYNDTEPPQIGHMTGAPSELKVVFTEHIKPESAYNSIIVKDNSGNIINGYISVVGSRIYFNPDNNMIAGQYYNVHVKDTIEDIHGNRIDFNGAAEYVEAVYIDSY